MFKIHFKDGDWEHYEIVIGNLLMAVQYARTIQAYTHCSARIETI